MHAGNRFGPIRRATEALLARVQQFIVRGDYASAEKSAREALNNWRTAGAPKEEEGTLITTLGKCLEAQRKYEEAYELYMTALNCLIGAAYDEVYTNFLYLNERLGTFTDKRKPGHLGADQGASQGGVNAQDQSANQGDNEPGYPKGYFDDFGN
jgi:tetratricopeptide (TPR) repeat protein